MKTNNTRNKFYSYLIILFSIFILFFLTKNFFYTLQESLDMKSSYSSELIKQNEQLTELNNIKKEIESDKNSIEKKLNKFLISFDTKEFLNYIYDYVEKNNTLKNNIRVNNISFNK